ncbi:MAG: hypothetical protein ISR51_08660 [Rhodospirillales bacterium]|nr:hypothetical protein [Rhodospirillales bacterium]
MWRYGNDFRKAANAVLSIYSDRVFMPYYFLLGQSVELSLKAFLLGPGVSLKELRSRKYGHDLEALLVEARRHRLGIEVKLSSIDCAVIRLLNIEYLGKRFQYIQTGTMQIPEVKLAQEVADKLSLGLEGFCKKTV